MGFRLFAAMALPKTKLGAFLASEAGRRMARLVADRFRAKLHGAERIPREGGVLLVANHSILGIDAVPLTALIALETGRVPLFLGERSLWKVPFLSKPLDALGIVRGEREGAVRLLERGELVLVYPGGVEDSFKLSSEAYVLKWKKRHGFAIVAMRAKVPIVPIAATGIDELYEIKRREHLVGRKVFGSDRYDFPLPSNVVPRKVPLDYYVLPPIDTSGDVASPNDVERVRRATHDAIDEVLREYRERRGKRHD